MDGGKNNNMNTETSKDSNNVLKDDVLSIQLFTQNAQLQQQLQHQQMAYAQLHGQCMIAGNAHCNHNENTNQNNNGRHSRHNNWNNN